MEKLVLRLLLTGDELDIVHQKQIHIAVLIVKILGRAVFDGAHELVGKLVALDVDDALFRIALVDGVADGQQQVGFAEAGVAVDKEGIVGLAGIFRHGHGGGVGKAVGVADDEMVEGIAGHLGQRICGVLLTAGQFVVFGQHEQLKVGGKEIIECGFDAVAEAFGNDLLLKFRAGDEYQAAVVHLHGNAVEKPGFHSGRRELRRQYIQHLLPYILDGFHDLYPLRRALF